MAVCRLFSVLAHLTSQATVEYGTAVLAPTPHRASHDLIRGWLDGQPTCPTGACRTSSRNGTMPCPAPPIRPSNRTATPLTCSWPKLGRLSFSSHSSHRLHSRWVWQWTWRSRSCWPALWRSRSTFRPPFPRRAAVRSQRPSAPRRGRVRRNWLAQVLTFLTTSSWWPLRAALRMGNQ